MDGEWHTRVRAAELRHASAVSPSAGHLYTALCLFAAGAEQRTKPLPRAELAELTGLSVETIRRALPALEAAGLIAVHRQPGHPSAYQLLDPGTRQPRRRPGEKDSCSGARRSPSAAAASHAQGDPPYPDF